MKKGDFFGQRFKPSWVGSRRFVTGGVTTGPGGLPLLSASRTGFPSGNGMQDFFAPSLALQALLHTHTHHLHSATLIECYSYSSSIGRVEDAPNSGYRRTAKITFFSTQEVECAFHLLVLIMDFMKPLPVLLLVCFNPI